jgi:Copper transport outer membrane protein, MctB
MFDLRYHVASLAAVFVALIIGILVGVGLSGSGVTDKADLKVVERERDKAQSDRDAARAQVAELKKTQQAFELAYPAVMRDLLAGKRVAVLFVGAKDGGVSHAIENTLTDAGAEPPVRVVSLSVPIDAQDLDTALFAKGPQFVKYVGNDKLDGLGNELGVEFATGGQTPLWKVLGKQLIGERSGTTRQRVDGVVVVRTVKPQQGDTARFLRGFYSGLSSAGIPAVGVETSNSKVSAVGVFQDRGLSTVDDIDLSMGRASLAFLLAGAAPGKYGTRDVAGDASNNADAILPTFPSG